MKSRAVPKKEAVIQRVIKLYDRGMKPKDITDDLVLRGVDVNIQWVSYHLIRAGKIKSDRERAREKRDRRTQERLEAQLARDREMAANRRAETAAKAGDIVAEHRAAEKSAEIEARNRQEAQSRRMFWTRKERREEELAQRNSVRGRIGDLRDSVDVAYGRVCG